MCRVNVDTVPCGTGYYLHNLVNTANLAAYAVASAVAPFCAVVVVAPLDYLCPLTVSMHVVAVGSLGGG